MEFILQNTQGTDFWDEETSSMTSDVEMFSMALSDVWDDSLASDLSTATQGVYEGSRWDSTSGSEIDVASFHSAEDPGSRPSTGATRPCTGATRPCTGATLLGTGVDFTGEGDSDIDLKEYWDIAELTPPPSRPQLNTTDSPIGMVPFFAAPTNELPVRDKPSPYQFGNSSSHHRVQPSLAARKRHDPTQELGEDLIADLALTEETPRTTVGSAHLTDNARYILPRRGANLLDITNYEYYQRNLTATPERWRTTNTTDDEDEDADKPTGLGQWMVHGVRHTLPHAPFPRPRPLPDVSPWTTFGPPL